MLHREGTATILLSLGILIPLNALIYSFANGSNMIFAPSVIISSILLIIILQFFRNPKIRATVGDNLIVSPADGKVVVIEEVNDSEFGDKKYLQVSVFMSPFNVHVNRNPVSGIVKYFKYHPGKYLVAWHPKSSTENERTTTVIETKNNQSILFRQIAGALARRIVWYLQSGQEVNQSKEMGFIKFGSRVDILMPLDAKVKVKLNQKVKGGVTVLAEI